jgi:hypothetical protein
VSILKNIKTLQFFIEEKNDVFKFIEEEKENGGANLIRLMQLFNIMSVGKYSIIYAKSLKAEEVRQHLIDSYGFFKEEIYPNTEDLYQYLTGEKNA